MYYIYKKGEVMKVKIQESTYRGRPILQLFDEDASEEYRKYPLVSIGLRKAKALMAVKEEIHEFIKKNEEKNGKIHSNS